MVLYERVGYRTNNILYVFFSIITWNVKLLFLWYTLQLDLLDSFITFYFYSKGNCKAINHDNYTFHSNVFRNRTVPKIRFSSANRYFQLQNFCSSLEFFRNFRIIPSYRTRENGPLKIPPCQIWRLCNAAG